METPTIHSVPQEKTTPESLSQQTVTMKETQLMQLVEAVVAKAKAQFLAERQHESDPSPTLQVQTPLTLSLGKTNWVEATKNKRGANTIEHLDNV